MATGIAGIANAIYNATGVRVRDFPITLDEMIGRMARDDGYLLNLTRPTESQIFRAEK